MNLVRALRVVVRFPFTLAIAVTALLVLVLVLGVGWLMTDDIEWK